MGRRVGNDLGDIVLSLLSAANFCGRFSGFNTRSTVAMVGSSFIQSPSRAGIARYHRGATQSPSSRLKVKREVLRFWPKRRACCTGWGRVKDVGPSGSNRLNPLRCRLSPKGAAIDVRNGARAMLEPSGSRTKPGGAGGQPSGETAQRPSHQWGLYRTANSPKRPGSRFKGSTGLASAHAFDSGFVDSSRSSYSWLICLAE